MFRLAEVICIMLGLIVSGITFYRLLTGFGLEQNIPNILIIIMLVALTLIFRTVRKARQRARDDEYSKKGSV